MFDQFAGTFLINPAMLDFTGNTCSHRCAYCFASLNQPVRDAHFRQALKWVDNIKKRGSLTQILADEGYPICVSNRSDPLSDNNVAQTFAIVEKMKKLKNGFIFQTKGGKKQDDFVRLIEPLKDRTMVYITFTTDDEKMSKKIEPNAPTPAQRIELAKNLISAGIQVEIGLNPFLEEWFSTERAIAAAEMFTEMGVKSFFVQGLYLRQEWIDNFNDKRHKAFEDIYADDVIIKKGEYNYAMLNSIDLSYELLRRGFPVENPYILFSSRVADVYRNVYKIHAPILTDFYRYVAACPDDKIFTWKDFVYGCAGGDENNLKAYNRDIGRTLAPYIFRISKRGYLECNATDQNPTTIAGLLKTVWKSKYFKLSPQKSKGSMKVVGYDGEHSPLLKKDLTTGFYEVNSELNSKHLWTQKILS